MNAIPEIRPSPIAGMWYSDDPRELAAQIDGYLDTATRESIDGEVIAVIAPHAGLRYSGRTAGHAFSAVSQQARNPVAVLSPFHNYHPAQIVTTAHHAYATPLGRMTVRRDMLAVIDGEIRKAGLGGLVWMYEDPEHALEIELPFLQRALTNKFDILPLMVRTHQEAICELLGTVLAETLIDTGALLVASTDLSHFYPEHSARQLDATMLDCISDLDPAGIFQVQTEGRGYACGAGAVATTLYAARRLGADAVKIVHYSTSADETGDSSSVVGYGAAVVYRRKAA